MTTAIKAFVGGLFALGAGCSQLAVGAEVRSHDGIGRGFVEDQMASADYDYGAEIEGEAERTPVPFEDEEGERSGRFLIPGYWLPVPYQYDAGSCLFMSATGIAEWLYRRATGRVLDLSERYTISAYNLHKETLQKAIPGFRLYTDLPLVYKHVGHYVLDSSLKFTTEWVGKKFSARVNWKIVSDTALPRSQTRVFERMRRDVLFSVATRSSPQLEYGIMQDSDIEAIKDALRTRQSPVLLTYHPPTANWWHANIIVGYDEARGVFLTRDSAFGRERVDYAEYTYGTTYDEDDKRLVDLYEMSFAKVKAQGNHAAVYYLAD
jgi:hypothetical protein